MAFAPILVEASDEAALTLEEAKAHLVVDHDDDDDYIQSLIAVAQAHLDGPDGILGMVLMDSAWRQTIDVDGERVHTLPYGPVTSITSASLDGVAVAGNIALGYRDSGVAVASFAAMGRGSLVIDYRAGALAPAKIPAPLIHAMKLHIGSMYEYREMEIVGASATDLPHYKALTDPYRRRRVG